jgi:effector-binding domain-containing protein
MIDTPHILTHEERPIAIIPITCPRELIQHVMGPGIQELMATIAAQGISPVGSWFAHHLRMDPKEFDFEISVPVSKPVTAAGRVKPSIWPTMKVARTVYQGGYEGLGDAWREFDTWIKEQKLKPCADLWECYVKGPESGLDSSHYRTELYRPLAE